MSHHCASYTVTHQHPPSFAAPLFKIKRVFPKVKLTALFLFSGNTPVFSVMSFPMCLTCKSICKYTHAVCAFSQVYGLPIIGLLLTLLYCYFIVFHISFLLLTFSNIYFFYYLFKLFVCLRQSVVIYSKIPNIFTSLLIFHFI